MQRFFSKVEKSDNGCWIWKASGRGNGYGAFKFRNKVIDAHRVSWILHNGEIPDGFYICHKCDIRKCVNPAHLFLGTHSDNMKDCYQKNRMVIPTNSRFIKNNTPYNKHYSDKFVELIIDAIRNKGKTSLKQLSEILGVKYQFLRDLNSGRSYSKLKT